MDNNPTLPSGMTTYTGWDGRSEYACFDGVQPSDAAAWAAHRAAVSRGDDSVPRPCTCGSGVVWASCPGNTNGCCG